MHRVLGARASSCGRQWRVFMLLDVLDKQKFLVKACLDLYLVLANNRQSGSTGLYRAERLGEGRRGGNRRGHTAKSRGSTCAKSRLSFRGQTTARVNREQRIGTRRTKATATRISPTTPPRSWGQDNPSSCTPDSPAGVGSGSAGHAGTHAVP